MKKLKIKSKHLEILQGVTKINPSDINKIDGDLYVLKLTDEQIDKVLDDLSDYLSKYGMEGNDELNSVGDEVETLIGMVSKIYYE